MDKKLKIEFAPGCFDSFDGTQEELDELVAEIQRMAETGELFEKSNPLDIDEMIDEEPEVAERILKALLSEETAQERKLQ
jgi:hypothetical protein